MLSVLKNIAERCAENINEATKYILGKREFAFMMEQNKKTAEGMTWYEDTIDDHDIELKKDKFGRSSKVLEVQDSYVLERDTNYVYCERKRLFQIGLDSRLGTNYHAGLIQDVEKKREDKAGVPA